MTVARWFSLIVGLLIMPFFSKDDDTKENTDTNIFDVIIYFIGRITASILIIVPLVLEFMERKI